MSTGIFMTAPHPSLPKYSIPQYRYSYNMLYPQFYDRPGYNQQWINFPAICNNYSRHYPASVGTSQERTYSQSRKRPFTIAAILELNNDEDTQNKKARYQSHSLCPGVDTVEQPEPEYVSSSTSSDKAGAHYLGADKSRSLQSSGAISSPLSPEPRSPVSDSTTDSSESPRRKKRMRTIFTPDQLDRLESEFERTQYLVGEERLQLASELSLKEAQVKIWFQNRRIKQRKQHDEIQRAKIAKLKSIHNDSEESQSDLSNSIFKELSSLSASSDESSRTE